MSLKTAPMRRAATALEDSGALQMNDLDCYARAALWRARLLADLIFATAFYRVLLSKSRVLFVPGRLLSMPDLVTIPG